MRKISDSRLFLWVSSEHTKWPSNDFSLIWTEWTPLGTCVKLLWFASSSNQWILAEDSPQGPDYIICSSPFKWSSAVLMLVTSGCGRIPSGRRFALFCGGCYIIDFIVHVSSYFLQSTLHCSWVITSVSWHFIVNVSLLLPSVDCPSHSFGLSQSISFIFTLFGYLPHYMFFKPYCQFRFSAKPVSGN